MKKRKIFIIILSVLIVLLSLLLAKLLFSNSKNNNTTKTADPLFVDEITTNNITVTTAEAVENKQDNNFKKNDSINILLCGIDESSTGKYWGRSDSMMIVSVNKTYKTIRIASLSRAVYVDIKGYKSGRLSSAYSYGGPNLLKETIENNYKIDIDNYVCINFDTYKKIIDSFGGVEIYLSDKEAKAVENSIKYSNAQSSYVYKGSGVYNLDGGSALEYSRLRYIDSDRERTARQRKVVEKLYYKIYSFSKIQRIKLINKISPLLVTDFTSAQMLAQFNRLSGIDYTLSQTVIPDKSSNLTLVDDTEVLFVDWNETRNYANSFLYSPPDKIEQSN